MPASLVTASLSKSRVLMLKMCTRYLTGLLVVVHRLYHSVELLITFPLLEACVAPLAIRRASPQGGDFQLDTSKSYAQSM